MFKYFSTDRIDVLSQLQIRFTPLGGLNDPFEGWPRISGAFTPKDAHLIINFESPTVEPTEKELNALLATFPEFIRGAMTVNEVRSLYKYLLGIKIKSDSSCESIAHAYASQRLDGLLGALCLSEVCDSILMWSHYAKSHAGFVIEFDTSNDWFKGQGEFLGLRRVLYRDGRPHSCVADLGLAEVALTKSAHWVYEREWRMMRPLAGANDVMETSQLPVHLFSIPPEVISAVVFGARVDRDLKSQILEAVRRNGALSHVSFRAACVDPYSFNVVIEECDQNKG